MIISIQWPIQEFVLLIKKEEEGVDHWYPPFGLCLWDKTLTLLNANVSFALQSVLLLVPYYLLKCFFWGLFYHFLFFIYFYVRLFCLFILFHSVNCFILSVCMIVWTGFYFSLLLLPSFVLRSDSYHANWNFLNPILWLERWFKVVCVEKTDQFCWWN